MSGGNSKRVLLAGVVCLTMGAAAQEPEEVTASGANCTFKTDPEEFLGRQARARRDVFQRMGKLDQFLRRGAAQTVSPDEIPRRSFIDIEIFDKMSKAGVRSASLSSDEEFLRRLSLDLTGRTPSPEDIRAFLADGSPDKRTALISKLLYSPEFTDKWTVWMGDLLQNTQTSQNVTRAAQGRNTFHNWIKGSIADGKPLKDMVYELVTGRGNNYRDEEAASNFAIGSRTVGGPAQDNFDGMLYKTASTFLGLGHYDCLICHDGRRRLDLLTVWGSNGTRLDAYKMAAFFSRLNVTQNNDRASPMFQSWDASDRLTGTYDLNTNFGNRPNRTPIGTLRNITPEYRDTGAKPTDGDWRSAFAENLMKDPMLPVNFANRIWKSMFNLALAEPVDQLDPARLDPSKAPPAPWTFQATHPELLQQLSRSLVESNYNLREFLRLIVESSAYQLSSRYDGEWKPDYVPYFARHFARRLEGEEIHDAIVKATGMFTNYTITGWGDPVRWAGQLPEPTEPRSNGAANNFMNAFFRGNRDTLQRSQGGSILQQLFMMNDAFVLNRTRVAASPNLLAVSRITDNNQAVEEIFLLFLSRRPTDYERGAALDHLRTATTAALRNTALEDLAWAATNKLEFIFSY